MPSELTPIVRFIEPPDPAIIAKGVSVGERVTLDEVNRKVAAEESLESIIDFLFETTRTICRCDRIGLAFVEEDGQRLVSYYDVASYEPLLLDKGYTEDVAGSTLKKVIEKGVPRIIDDLEAYMHLAIAERLSQAVEKVWRIKQLTDANNSYTETIGFVSHELKSPLAAIVMSGKVLTDDLLGKMEPKQHDMVGKMVRQAEMLLGLIREYLDLSRLEGGKMELHLEKGVDFREKIVEPTIESLAPQIEERKSKVELDVPKGLAIGCDPGLLSIVVMNLVGNAVKYGNEGGTVKVKAAEGEGLLHVSVWNEGAGFTEEQKRALFKKFSRIKDPEPSKRKGTGLGLYTTWRLINMHGGKIWADSEKGKWADIAFRIPLRKSS